MAEPVTSVGIVGLGLIGGSLLRAAHGLGLAVAGFDESAETRAAARRAGYAVVEVMDELAERELLVLAVPLPALEGVLPRLAGFRGLLTDVTSVKEPVRRLVARYCPGVRFVGGHPMAGKETSGFSSSAAGLFTDRVWVLCLDPETDMDDAVGLAETVCALGGRLVPATSSGHDAAAARISHVPHVVAAAVTLLAADPLSRTLAAGSFTDATRVALSRPELVAAMCGGNAERVHAELDRLIDELTTAREQLSSPDGFRDWYTPAHRLRCDWPPTADSAQTIPLSKDDLLALGRDGGWVCGIDRAARSAMVRRPAARLA